MVQKVNFAEDPLRVLKGIRMAVSLDLTIDPPTMQAMHQYASAVAGVAAERVSAELDAILTEEERTRGLVLLSELGLDEQLFSFSLSPDMIEAVALTSGGDTTVAYAVLFFNGDQKSLDDFASRWRWSERHRRQTSGAIEMARRVLGADRGDLPLLIYDFGLDTSRRAVQLLYAFERDREADALGEILESRGEGIAMLRPLLEGERIQEATGIPPGPEVGRLKRAMMEAQLRGEISTPAEATELVKRLAAG
jgi:tRNA nucleotidyltransferase/poly(A) polymerase